MNGSGVCARFSCSNIQCDIQSKLRAWSTGSREKSEHWWQQCTGAGDDNVTKVDRKEVDVDAIRFPPWVYEYKLRWPDLETGNFSSPLPHTHSPAHTIAVRNALADFHLAVYHIDHGRYSSIQRQSMLEQVISVALPTMHDLGLVFLATSSASRGLT